MARYSAGHTPSGVGTTLRPCSALGLHATVSGLVREVAVFNSTATACNFELVLFSGATTWTGDLSEIRHRRNSAAATVLGKDLATANVTVDERTGYIFELGAAIGDGAIEVFGSTGLETPLGANSGIGLLLIAGTPLTAPRVRWGWDE